MTEVKESKLLIRNARPDELDAVAGLIRAAYQEYKTSVPQTSWEAYERDMADVRSRLGMAELIVAELDGQLVGAVTLFLDPSLYPNNVWSEGWSAIRLLAVHPDFRGRDVGHRLMDECLRRARLHGSTTIGLHTGEIMEAARKLYEHMGFMRAPEFDFHPAPGVDVMAYRFDFEDR